MEAVTLPTGPRTWASILQSVTTDPGPGEQGQSRRLLFAKSPPAFVYAYKLGLLRVAAQKERAVPWLVAANWEEVPYTMKA